MAKNPEIVEQGVRLQRIREGLGLSRTELAGRIGVKSVTIRNAENGNSALSRDRWLKVARLAGIEANQAPEDVAYLKALDPQKAVVGNTKTLEALLVQAFKEAEEPAIARAVASLVDALGVPREQAMAMVVARKLNGQ